MGRNLEFNLGSQRPVPVIQQGAENFARQMGVNHSAPNYGSVLVDRNISHAVGRAYQALPEYDHAAIPAYQQMRHEVGRQFDYLTRPRSRGGLGIHVESTAEDPYSNTRQVFEDLLNNRRLKVLSTATTGGHPFFNNDENDQFRAVHDAFGHAGTGRGFDMHGEDAAYMSHARMFSPMARRALATETRGQNGALHLTGSFQDQKVALLPDKFVAPVPLIGRRTAFANAISDARAENKKWFE